MRRTWTIIGVENVARSFRWYQSLLGLPESARRGAGCRAWLMRVSGWLEKDQPDGDRGCGFSSGLLPGFGEITGFDDGQPGRV